jgi:hypothetical protein
MAELHGLIALHGREGAKLLVPESEHRLIDLAANVMENSQSETGITYSGFCLTSLPHRQIGETELWKRPGENLTLVVMPGSLRIGGEIVQFGVPFGSRARMILLYLQSQAQRTGSPEVELGRSMRDWMMRMNVPLGGKSSGLVREQANRLSACNLAFFYHGEEGEGFEKGSIIKSGFRFANTNDLERPNAWVDRVRLDDHFYRALMSSPVALREAAVREISGKSLSLDIYIWLAYLLPTLRQDKAVEWAALYRQFGAGYDEPRLFRRRFLDPLKTALAVYPEAKIKLIDKGLLLSPSRTPVEARIHAVAAIAPPTVNQGEFKL